MNRHVIILWSVLMAICLHAYPQHVRKEYEFSYIQRFYFKLDKYNIDETMSGNAAAVDSILYKLRYLKQIGAEGLRIHVIGSASLEASEEYNARLASNRSRAFIDYMKRFALLEGVDMHADDGVYDWNVLYDNVKVSDCPHRDELLRILEISNADINITDRKNRILALGNGTTYNYIKLRYFHLMRYASIRITADKMPVAEQPKEEEPTSVLGPGPLPPPKVEKPVHKKPWLVVGVRSNMLMDAALFPNIGVEMYVSKNISVGANWMYSWWKSDKKSLYWRTYGGDIHADYWFGENPRDNWEGHHVGVYGQMLTYDFEWKGKGYQGPRWSYGGGISYGYAVSLSKYFSLDFGLGIGYFGGKYYEYIPGDKKTERDKYYITDTQTLRWFGPTKAEVSLIWKLGK